MSPAAVRCLRASLKKFSIATRSSEPVPLTALTLEQARLLSQQTGLPVYVGMRNWKPYIADVVRMMRTDGVAKFAAICLAPQNSRTSVGLYKRAVFAETDDMRVDFIEGWAEHPLLADAFAERLRAVRHSRHARPVHRP